VILLFIHPVAFLVAFLAFWGASEIARPESNWPAGALFGAYILAYWLLPWWTRPLLLWRYWRAKKRVQAEANQFPTWPGRPE
jgi:hypothetical protein